MKTKRGHEAVGFEAARKRLVGIEPPERVHRQSRARLAELLTNHFKAEEARRRQANPVMTALRESVIAPLKEDKNYKNKVRAVRELAAARAKEKVKMPRVVPVKPRIFTGSINLTATPPYTWPWTWSATSGSPDPPMVSADNNAGTMSFFLHAGDGGGSASVAAAVGVFVQPMVDIGILSITASPAFNYMWWTYNAFDSSHSDGWMGIYVGAYTLDGSQYAVPIDQQVYLWNESHSFLDSPSGQGSNSGFPLSAATFVNGDSFYEVWIWCGGNATADGYHTFWGSWAGSSLNVAVPSINMELF